MIVLALLFMGIGCRSTKPMLSEGLASAADSVPAQQPKSHLSERQKSAQPMAVLPATVGGHRFNLVIHAFEYPPKGHSEDPFEARHSVTAIEVFDVNGVRLQTLKPSDNQHALSDWRRAFAVEDLNFDGFNDVRLLKSESAKGQLNYEAWLAQPHALDSAPFKGAPEFQAIPNPEISPETNSIYGVHYFGDDQFTEYTEQIYRFVDGQFKLFQQTMHSPILKKTTLLVGDRFIEAPRNAVDYTQVRERVRALYQWRYAFQTLLDYQPEPEKDGFYKGLDRKHLKLKVRELKESGHFSAGFVARWKRYFEGIDHGLRTGHLVWPTNSLPGFMSDVDRWCNCQDYRNLFWTNLELHNLKVLRYTEEDVVVAGDISLFWTTSGRHSYGIELVKRKGGWVVDRMAGFPF